MSDIKPVVRSGIVTEFGVLEDDPATLMNEMGMNRDVTYVPGFSDMRRANDLAKAEKRFDDVVPLPVNLRWARSQKANGTPDSTRVVRHRMDGYVPVTKEDVGQPWLKELPPGAEWRADGTLANADSVLMKCTQKRAQQNEARKTIRWMEQNTANTEQAIKQASTKVKGSTAEVSKEIGSPISS